MINFAQAEFQKFCAVLTLVSRHW